MSTTTTQHKVKRPQIKAQPNRVCVGYVSEIPPFAETEVKVDAETGEEKPQYYFSNVSMKGTKGSQDVKFGLLLRPEWFVPSFDLDTQLAGAGEASSRSLEFVYQNNVANPVEAKVSTLDAIAGSRSNFDDLYSELVSATEANNGELTADEIHTIIANYANNNGGEVGYILGQKLEPGVDGKKVPTQFMEVKSFFFIDPDTTNGLPRFIQKQVDAGKARIAFEQ